MKNAETGGGTEVRRDPASRFLAPAESWRPRTWTHFRYSVLRHIHEFGAHSLNDLAATGPEVLFLPLNRAELRATLDSARRRGLIAPLDPSSGRAQISSREEWVLTDSGRRAIRHGIPWLAERLESTPKYFSAFLSLVGAISLGTVVSKWINAHEAPAIVLVASALVVAVTLLGLLILAIRSRGAGVNARQAVARDWHRWAAVKPGWSHIAGRVFPRRWFVAAIIYLIALSVAVALIPEFGDSDVAFPISLSVLWAICVPILEWSERWDVIAKEAKKERG